MSSLSSPSVDGGRAAPPHGAVALLCLHYLTAEFGWSRLPTANWVHWAVALPLWSWTIWYGIRTPALNAVLWRRPYGYLAAYLCIMIMSTIWAVDPSNAVPVTVGIVASAFVAAGGVAAYGWGVMTRAIAVAGTSLCLASLVADGFGYPTRESDRLIGLAKNYSEAGIGAALTGVVLFSLLRRRPVLCAVAMVPSVLVLYLSDARTSTAGMVIGVLTVSIVDSSGWRRHLRLAFVMTCVAGITAVLTGTTRLTQVVGRYEDGGDIVTFTGRTTVWRVAFEEIARAPWIGLGQASSVPLFEQAARDGRVQIPAYHAHNAFVQAALQYGVLSAILLAALFGSYVLSRRHVTRDGGRDGVMIVIAIVGMTEAMYHEASAPVMVLSGALASLTVAVSERRDVMRSLVLAPVQTPVARTRASNSDC